MTTSDVHPDVAAAAALLAGLPHDVWRADADAELYGWYLAVQPLPRRTGVEPVDVDLPAALAAAHAEAERFVGGWTAHEVGGRGEVVAGQGDRRRLLGRTDYVVPVRPGLRARPGDRLLVRAAWTWTDDEHAFWYARRGAWPPVASEHLVRHYLAVAPGDAPAVVAALTGLLAAHGDVSYQLKTTILLDHPGRSDAAVLYLGDRDERRLAADLRDLFAGLSPALRPGRPRFTDPVAGVVGVGRAECTLAGESFGVDRCEAIVRAWWELPTSARADEPAVLDAVVAGLRSAGVDPARPALLANGIPASLEPAGAGA